MGNDRRSCCRGGKYHDEIGLWGFSFSFFGKDEEGFGKEGFIVYSYLLILTKIWTEYWKNQLERIDMKVDEDTGKSAGMVNVWYRKI